MHAWMDRSCDNLQVTFHLPANIVVSPHKDTMCRIRSLHDGTLVSCSQVRMGQFNEWLMNLSFRMVSFLFGLKILNKKDLEK